MRRFLLSLILAISLAGPALANDYVTPYPLPSGNVSGTITVTNTFQSIQQVNNSRHGCAVQNKGTNSSSDTMWVYFDPTNSSGCSAASKAASFTLSPGQSANCNVGTIILSDQICITGTGGDGFAANFQ